jgi:hypothetical protein
VTVENTPEYVAMKLLEVIAANEGKKLVGVGVNADRKWLLRAYAQCIYTVKTGAFPTELE